MGQKGVQHWKKRKAIAMYLNRRQLRAYLASLTPATSATIEMTTESGVTITTENNEWIIVE